MAGAPIQVETGRPMPAARHVDVGVHGVLDLRLIDPRPEDVEAISRQLGTETAPGSGSPDVVIEFVRDLDGVALPFLESRAVSFGEDGLLRLTHGTRSAGIDFRGIGRQCRIVCESGIRRIPLLESIVDVSVLSKGFAAMHASAFVHRGRRIIATGWTHGGKTTALLAFAAHGATFVSDDRVWIHRDGKQTLGFSGEISLGAAHLAARPADFRLVSRSRRSTLGLLSRIESAGRRHGAGGEGRSSVAKLVRKGASGLRRHLTPGVPPERLFDHTETAFTGRPHAVFVMIRHDDPTIRVEPITTRRLTDQAWATAQQALEPLSRHYLTFCFALPGMRNAWLERAHRMHRETLASALRVTRAFAVYLPEGADPLALYDTLEPLS
jgi:hypothetical protein